MTSLAFAARDSATMFRRDLRHAVRFPMMTVSGMLTPVVLLLLFVGIFGRALHSALAAVPGGGSYTDYLTPGILVMAAGFAAEGTAVHVCQDMNDGIIPRFRTMAISRASVLTGQVVGATLRTIVSAAAVVGVAVLVGFRSSASPSAWVAALGLFALLTLALTWLTVGFGLLAKTPAGANSLALIPAFLPFLSSAFVPVNAVPNPGVRWFAAHEPFTPVIAALRGLLTGGPIGDNATIAVAWCVGLAVAGYLWSRTLYTRPQRARVRAD